MVPSLLTSDGETRFLGRVKPKARPRTLHLQNYIESSSAASLPDSVDHKTAALASIKNPLLNNRLGCCVISSTGHGLGIWSGNESKSPIVPTDAEIAAAYNKFKIGPGDSGCSIPSVLDGWTSGITLGGKASKIDGYVAVDWRQKPLIQAGIVGMGGGRLGIDLPQAWANTNDGDAWEATNSRIVGGHDVRMVDYDKDGVWIATWGGLRIIPWDVLATARYFDEAYVELAPDWYAEANQSPSGIDAADLAADLKLLGNGTLPPIVATPPPFDWSDFA